MFKNKIVKLSMLSLVLAGGGIAIANTTTSCRTSQYDLRASVSLTSMEQYYNFFSSKTCKKMISPKHKKDYSMGYTKDACLPSKDDWDFKDYWNEGDDSTGKHHVGWKDYSTEIINEMTAGDMCVLMMVALNYEGLMSLGELENVDKIFCNTEKMSDGLGDYSFVVDMGFEAHTDAGVTNNHLFHTEKMNSIWLIDDDLELSVGGMDVIIDTLYSLQGFFHQMDGSLDNTAENIWLSTYNAPIPPEPTPQQYHALQLLALVNPIKLVFPSYTFPVFDIKVGS